MSVMSVLSGEWTESSVVLGEVRQNRKGGAGARVPQDEFLFL